MSRKEKDLDEDLVRFSQFPLGEMPERANTTPLWDVFKEHIVEAASEQGIAVAPVHRAFNDLDGDDDSRDFGPLGVFLGIILASILGGLFLYRRSKATPDDLDFGDDDTDEAVS